MRIVLFVHSLASDWNHGNAHFVRGVCDELVLRGHDVVAYDPEGAWSRENLVRDHGTEPLDRFAEHYPRLSAARFDPDAPDLDALLDGADAVLVHEWNPPALVAAIGRHRRAVGSYRLLFHDTHHRMASDRQAMDRYRLVDYDAVLAFGRVLADLYEDRGLAARVFVWHEAADVRRFRPPDIEVARSGVVWIGNWGDDERARELEEFLISPVERLAAPTSVYGVRYPAAARARLRAAGIAYRGWLANFDAPAAYARARATVHVPRRPYAEALPGVPTIRMFEALACGVPLVSAPWSDAEGLFRGGEDFLSASSGAEMEFQLGRVLADDDLAAALARSGGETILARHTCAHRVDELLAILAELGAAAPAVAGRNVP
jgi:spore maturation protein CgeB